MAEKEADKKREGEGRGWSRRDFLRRGPIGIAGGLALGAIGGRLLALLWGRRRRAARLPEGSIFTPADDEDERT